MRIAETCTCGAGITVEDDERGDVAAEVERWRTHHQCGGVNPWRHDRHGTTSIDLAFGFQPVIDRPMEAT